jgi:hypothetical protein
MPDELGQPGREAGRDVNPTAGLIERSLLLLLVLGLVVGVLAVVKPVTTAILSPASRLIGWALVGKG